MIYSLRGTLIYFDNVSAVIECGGVGYKCTVSSKTISKLPEAGSEAFLYTYMAVREDAVDLYGFASLEELNCFKLVTAVSGVGSKTGISILSAFTPDELYLSVMNSDAKSITRAGGVGLKTAQRIVLELKDKVSDFELTGEIETAVVKETSSTSQNVKDAIEVLISFGYSRSEATRAINKVDHSLGTDMIIKEALKQLSRM